MDDKLKNDFVQFMRLKRGRKEVTIKGYLAELSKLEEISEIPLINHDVRSLDALMFKVKTSRYSKKGTLGHSDRTTAKIASILKQLLDVAVYYGYIEGPHPWQLGHGFEKGKSPEAEFFDRETDLTDINRALFYPFMPLRDRAIIWLLFSTGIRLGELCGLNIGDIDMMKKWVHVRKNIGKGEKWRYVPFDDLCSQVLREYIFGMECVFGVNAESPLFQTKEGTRLKPGSVWKRLDLIGDEIRAKINPHKWRHSLASFLAQKTGPFNVALLMGHESIQTTMTYVHVKPQTLQKSYNDAISGG